MKKIILLLLIILQSCIFNEKDNFVDKVMKDPDNYQKYLDESSFSLKYYNKNNITKDIKKLKDFVNIAKEKNYIFVQNSITNKFNNVYNKENCKMYVVTINYNFYFMDFLWYESEEGIIYYDGLSLHNNEPDGG